MKQLSRPKKTRILRSCRIGLLQCRNAKFALLRAVRQLDGLPGFALPPPRKCQETDSKRPTPPS
eukprot:12401863-Alexandrium_andersonii.AAC.1